MDNTGPINEYQQPVGRPVFDWRPPPRPAASPLAGRHCAVEPLDPDRHADMLAETFAAEPDDRDWTYLNAERPPDRDAYRSWLEAIANRPDPMFFAIVLPDARAVGVAAYLRIEPAHGVIEVGHIHYGAPLRRSRAGTEAMFLMMQYAFGLGYRRYEWKCDSLNDRSCAAALRYGFRPEGVFRNAVVTKRRNRDTAWFAMTDDDWPTVADAFRAWLDDRNFDAAGRPIRSLRSFRT